MNRIYLSFIEKAFLQKKVVILVGQRQVGKTYEMKQLQKKYGGDFFDFEDEAMISLFHTPSVDLLESLLGKKEESRFVYFDEIQYLPKVGSILKLLHDHFPQTRVVASGSASFLLLNNIGDSLYGRSAIISVYPLSVREILDDFSSFPSTIDGYNTILNKPKIDAMIPQILQYGSLPGVFLENSFTEKVKLLQNYIDSFLLKDIFEIEGIRNHSVFKKCLQMLAFQIGSEVNPNEIASALGVSRNTITEYISILEKFHIIHSLPAYSKFPRKEVTKNKKIFFVDLGIRNALINNFSPMDLRNDFGALFENFVINHLKFSFFAKDDWGQWYFWRNYQNAEVDCIIEKNNILTPVEIKYSKMVSPSRAFLNAYSDRIEKSFCITRENFWKFV